MDPKRSNPGTGALPGILAVTVPLSSGTTFVGLPCDPDGVYGLAGGRYGIDVAGWAVEGAVDAKGCDAGGTAGPATVGLFFVRAAAAVAGFAGGPETPGAPGLYGLGVLSKGLAVRAGSGFFCGRTTVAGASYA